MSTDGKAKNPLFKLGQLGQSVWYDDISRGLIRSGELQELIDEYAVVGVTSNPSIFEKAIGGGTDYDEDLRRLTAEGKSPEEIFMEVALKDVSDALDVLSPTFAETDGVDGRVSMEVLASLANDTEGTNAMVRDIWRRVNKPNLYVKIPATEQGIPSIEQMLYEGNSINITLIFGLDYYRRVAEAYVNAMERRLAEGKDLHDVTSVASFFVSRVDTKVDKMLVGLVEQGRLSRDDASRLQGGAANANAKLAYQIYEEIFKSERFRRLEAQGARPQRCLWASTSTKNPAYPDTLYVEDLVGPETVNTMPRTTLEAYRDRGNPQVRIGEGVEEARALMSQLGEVGVDMQRVTDELIEEGVRAFADAFDKLLGGIRSKAEAVKAGA